MVQGGEPLGFYACKSSDAQLNYTVGKKELLGIVEGFKTLKHSKESFEVWCSMYAKLGNNKYIIPSSKSSEYPLSFLAAITRTGKYITIKSQNM